MSNSQAPAIAFLFTGQGSQYPNMGKVLGQKLPIFHETMQECCRLFTAELGQDLYAIIYPATGEEAKSEELLKQTLITQPALFSIEYALAKTWQSLGVRPNAMIGHSIGELVAACVSGVFRLEDAVKIVANRGKLMQQMQPGAMLAVGLTEEKAKIWTSDKICLAVVNGENACVLAGPLDAIAEIEPQLKKSRVMAKKLQTSHAFHSPMMEPALAPFQAVFQNITLSEPQIPYLSNVTGSWITAQQATSPAYWGQQIRSTVRFHQGLSRILAGCLILIELGPGSILCNLSKRHPVKNDIHWIGMSLTGAGDSDDDAKVFGDTLAHLADAQVPVTMRSLA